MLIKHSTSNGIVILYAVLLVSIVLVISLSLFNITYKQLVLSSVAQESQKAFFASDTARNCSKFLDITPDSNGIYPFGHYNTSAHSYTSPQSGSIVCAGVIISTTVSQFTIPTGTFDRTSFSFPVAGQSCARVTVDKNTNPDNRLTTITASGYNLCDNSSGPYQPAQNNRTVERTVRTEYSG
ncbi:MAG: hypothetical protein HYT48_00600 [Candidatus Vogelbacteria bacterium]|nr:hypothetical protein [Candidatus Vogelbacteria bacterium]